MILFVGVAGDNSTVSAITYGGVSMTLISTLTTPGTVTHNYLYYLKNPSIGTHTVSITTGGNNSVYPVAVSYTQAAFGIDASNTNTTAGATSLITHVTTTVDKDWTIALCQASGGTLSAGNGILRKANAGALHTTILDSNGFVSPAGDTNLRINDDQSQAIAMIIAAFKPGLLGGGFFAFF